MLSSTSPPRGLSHQPANAVGDGAATAGADVRLGHAAELTPETAINTNSVWRARLDATSHISIATLEDLTWADAYAFGMPSRHGNAAVQLKQFPGTIGGLRQAGKPPARR